MQHDTFGLHEAIKKLERGKTIGMLSYCVALPAGAWFYGVDLSGFQGFASVVLSCFVAAVWLEARETRIEVLRASMRQVLMHRNPSIVHSEEW